MARAKTLAERVHTLEQTVEELSEAIERGPGKFGECTSCIRDLLAEERMAVSEVRRVCIGRGFGMGLIGRVKQSLGVKAYNEKGVWYWEL